MVAYAGILGALLLLCMPLRARRCVHLSLPRQAAAKHTRAHPGITMFAVPVVASSVFVTMSLAFRGLIAQGQHGLDQGMAAPRSHLVLAPRSPPRAGGMLWFSNLTAPDPYWVLPLLSVGLSYVLLDVSALRTSCRRRRFAALLTIAARQRVLGRAAKTVGVMSLLKDMSQAYLLVLTPFMMLAVPQVRAAPCRVCWAARTDGDAAGCVPVLGAVHGVQFGVHALCCEVHGALTAAASAARRRAP